MDQIQTPNHKLTFHQRLRLATEQWSRSYVFFCHLYAFALGWVFVVSGLWPGSHDTYTYQFWGEGGKLVLGIAYIITSTYAAFYPERRGWIFAVLLPSLTGIPTAIWPRVNPAALIFWAFVLLSLGLEIRKRLDSGEWGRDPQ